MYELKMLLNHLSIPEFKGFKSLGGSLSALSCYVKVCQRWWSMNENDRGSPVLARFFQKWCFLLTSSHHLSSINHPLAVNPSPKSRITNVSKHFRASRLNCPYCAKAGLAHPDRNRRRGELVCLGRYDSRRTIQPDVCHAPTRRYHPPHCSRTQERRRDSQSESLHPLALFPPRPFPEGRG